MKNSKESKKKKVLNPNFLFLSVAISVILSIATVVSCLQILEYRDFLYLYVYLAMIIFLILIVLSYKKGKNELMKISFISFLTGIFFIRIENFIGAIENVLESMLVTSIKNGIIVLDILTFAFFIFPLINYYIMNAELKNKMSTTKENNILLGIDMVLCIVGLIVNIIVKDIYVYSEDRILAIITLINMIVMLFIFIFVESVIFDYNFLNKKSKSSSSIKTIKNYEHKKK